MLRLRTFGGLSLENGGRLLVGAAGQRGRLAILAVLASAGNQGVSRDLLVAMFWPEKDEESARGALRHGLYKLRQDLGAPDLTLGTTELKLNPAVITSDVQEFDAAWASSDPARTVDLYTAPFLYGIHLGDAPEFERWADQERDRRAAQFRKALEELAQAARAHGELRLAADYWKRIATVDPLSATTAVGLIQALLQAGDRSGALKAALAHERVVRAELEIAADPAVMALIQQLRARSLPDDSQVNRQVEPRPGYDTHDEPASNPARQAPTQDIALPRTRPRPLTIVGSVIVASLALLLATALLSDGKSSLLAGVGERSSRVHPRTSIAVLPFDDLTTGSEHDYFAGGLHGELLTQLSRVGGLDVKSRSSVLAYGGDQRLTVRQIASELGVGTVVEANTQVLGNRLRVHVQLIDAQTDQSIWSDSFDRTIDDGFAIQAEIARKIVAAVGAALTGAETRSLTTMPTRSAEAFRLYLQGNDYWFNRVRSPANKAIVIESYDRALALDPEFALAHAAVSDVHGFFYITRADDSPGRLALQRRHAEEALRLAPDLPEAHRAMGGWYYSAREYPKAVTWLDSAVLRLPNDEETWARLGQVHRRMGNAEATLAAHVKTTQLVPSDAERFKELGVTYTWLHRHEDAVTALDRAVELAPSNAFHALRRAKYLANWSRQADSLRVILSRVPFNDLGDFRREALERLYADRQADSMIRVAATAPGNGFVGQRHYVPADLYLAWAQRIRGDSMAAARAFGEALRSVDSVLRVNTADERVHAARGFILAGLGRRDEARDEARWLRRSAQYRLDKFQGPYVALNRARILAQIGDVDEALREVEGLMLRPSSTSAYDLEQDPLLDPIRNDPRFRALVAPSR